MLFLSAVALSEHGSATKKKSAPFIHQRRAKAKDDGSATYSVTASGETWNTKRGRMTMFEMLMLLGFLYAGFAHLVPQAVNGADRSRVLREKKLKKVTELKGEAGTPSARKEEKMRGGRHTAEDGGWESNWEGGRINHSRKTASVPIPLRVRRRSGTA
jgi:hypothetical protein